MGAATSLVNIAPDIKNRWRHRRGKGTLREAPRGAVSLLVVGLWHGETDQDCTNAIWKSNWHAAKAKLKRKR